MEHWNTQRSKITEMEPTERLGNLNGVRLGAPGFNTKDPTGSNSLRDWAGPRSGQLTRRCHGGMDEMGRGPMEAPDVTPLEGDRLRGLVCSGMP